MTLDELLRKEREIWGEKRMSPSEIAVCLGVVYGDICRLFREHHEGREINAQELKKELGNLIASTVRWSNDLECDPEECVELALEAQRRYGRKKAAHA